jgi:hypothetical protein
LRSKPFENFLTLAVFCNTAVLALDGTFDEEETLELLVQFNNVFTWIFIVEMALKVVSLGPIGNIFILLTIRLCER